MLAQIWCFPLLLLLIATVLAFPISKYLVWILDGRYKPIRLFAWFENRLYAGDQDWKEYAASLMTFSIILFIFGFIVLSLQPYLPLNPQGKTLLAPSTIFHTVSSFMTNTDLQHYAGEVYLSNFSQIVFCILNLFVSAAMGLSVLAAIVRALRGERFVGNFYIDMWRVVVYIFLPISFVFALFFMTQGSPMTLQSSVTINTMENATQTIALGPVAAFEAIKMLGTNGGGFFGMNSAHPFENPTALSNFFNTLAMMLFPFAIVLFYGRMLNCFKHSIVIFLVMLVLMSSCIAWTIFYDTLAPNPAFTAHPAKSYVVFTKQGYQHLDIPAVEPLPVDQHLGNLEGKELRFGTSAGASYAAITTDVTCGAVNAEMDSLNPLAAIAPFFGMWLNCIFGGKGVGMINMLTFIIIGIFLAGMMVGRTPEYLGKKIGPKEVKLAIVALLLHPFLILLPSGLFAATQMGLVAISNPGAHGLSQIVYQMSSASANNGSAFDGLNIVYGFWNNTQPAAHAVAWDIATGLIILFGRYLPIIAPLAMAAYLGAKTPRPHNLGTLRVDTFMFGFLLLGAIVLIGALSFLPVTSLGPLAEHLGPIPFGTKG